MSNLTTILATIQPYTIGLTFAAIYIAEHIIPQRRELIDHRHDVKNMLIGVVNIVLAIGLGYVTQKVIIYCEAKNIGLLHWLTGNFWISTIAGFLLIDFFMYWWHRFNHTVPFFWRFHKLHHVDEKLNSTSAIRFHAVEVTLSYLYRLGLFVLFGIGTTAIVLHGLLYLPIVIFHHSNLRISEKWDWVLRHLIVTPHMHRIHHSKLRREANSNYSSLLPYWDLLFRSYTPKPEKEVEFGI